MMRDEPLRDIFLVGTFYLSRW